MRDEDDRAALARHHPQRLEQRIGLLRCQHRRRLVEDQHARVAVERLQNLDPLLLAQRQLPDPGARVDRDAIALAQLGNAPLDPARVDRELLALTAMVTEDHVLGDGEGRDEPEVLVHHADARIECIARRVERHRLPVQPNLAFVGAVEACEDVRERGLAGAVLTEERMHLALGRLEVDPVVCNDAGEPLRDASERDGCSHGESEWAGRTRPAHSGGVSPSRFR